MPMITCTDCNKEMSDAAPACPGCGRPNTIATRPDRPVGILLGLGIFLIPLVFSWFTLRKGHTTKAKVISFAWLVISIVFVAAQDGSTKSTASAPPTVVSSSSGSPSVVQSEQVIQVEIRQLLSDYKNNEIGADNKYKGSHVQVTGIVGNIKKDIMDNLYVTLGTGAQFEIPEVQAFFDDSMNNKLGSLSKGQKLTVVCRIDGLMMNILGKDCIIQ
ncbi:OB-fold protein [Pseudomonas farris]